MIRAPGRAAIGRATLDPMRAPSTIAITALLLSAAGCNEVVTGLGEEVQLLATVRGRIAPGVEIPPNARVGIVWAGVPVFVPYCHTYGFTPLDRERAVTDPGHFGCRDPFDVVPAVLGPSAPLDAGVEPTFSITIRQIPPSSAMVGAPGARVAYGSVVLYTDTDLDGELDFPRGCRGGGGGGNNGGGGQAVPAPDQRLSEPISGATFDNLTDTQLRVVFVEGTFDNTSYFYPAPEGCTTFPTSGFSLWSMGGMLSPDATCAVQPIDTPITVGLGRVPGLGGVPDDELVRSLSCVPEDRQTFPRELSQRTSENFLNPFQTRYKWECQADGSGTIVVVDTQCSCREVRTYPLAGCRDEVNCPVPEWDLRANPPSWWPCPQTRGP